MAGAGFGIDSGLKADFIDEALDDLAELEGKLVALEKGPDLHIVEAIFRPIHSIKGNSALLGFVEVKALAHDSEAVLDLARKGELNPDKDFVDLIMRSVVAMSTMLSRTREGTTPLHDGNDYDNLMRDLGSYLGRATAAAMEDWHGIFEEMRTLTEDVRRRDRRMAERLEGLSQRLERLSPDEFKGDGGEGEHPRERIRALLPDKIDDVLPEAKVAPVLKALEEFYGLATDQAAQGIVDELKDGYATFNDCMGFDEMLRDFILRMLTQSESQGTWSDPVRSEPDELGWDDIEDLTVDAEHKDSEKVKVLKTMRVAEEQIDTFLTHVGELLVVGDTFSHLEQKLQQSGVVADLQREFKRAVENFHGLSNDLQKSIMGVRRLPIKNLLRKVPRLTRDLQGQLDKKVRVVLQGEDVLVDKSHLEILDAPLVHMVRNALDHGIENSQKRVENGKPEEGSLTISAFEDEGLFHLKIQDDGAGIDVEKLRQVLIDRGHMRESDVLTDAGIVDFIFSSGVSTADEVTDVSGRGVGLDVVRTEIRNAGGDILLENTPGKGCSFSIVLPRSVTTQIVDGYLVLAGGTPYVLPLDRVLETAVFEGEDFHHIPGKGFCIERHNQIVPARNLEQLLSGESVQIPVNNGARQPGVLLMSNGACSAMIVDDVRGTTKVVLRPIEGLGVADGTIQGGALLGDGGVALVLDVDACNEIGAMT